MARPVDQHLWRSPFLPDAFDRLITPPFAGAPVVAWAAFVFLCFAGGSIVDVWKGNLSDPDNYLYLLRALDFLKGQSWFDPLQYRLNPPEGMSLHYTPLLSGLYAFLIVLLRPIFGVEPQAALATSIVVPLVFLAAFLFVMQRTTQILTGKRWSGLSALFVLFSPCIITRFLPGYLDHHGIVLLLTILAFGFLAQLVMDSGKEASATLAGVLLALALAFALETLPIIIFLCAGFGVCAAVKGKDAIRKGFTFALCFFLGAFACLLATRGPNFLAIDFLSYSIVYVIFVAGIALAFAGLLVVADRTTFVRCAFGLALACALAALFLAVFPELRRGPYGAAEPSVAALIFGVAPESWPIVRGNRFGSAELAALFYPLLAVGANMSMLVFNERHAARWAWALCLAALIGCLVLAVFYQVRFMTYVEAFAVFPLVAATAKIWGRDKKVTSKICFSGVLFLALLAEMTDAKNAVERWTPAPSAKAPGCPVSSLAAALNDKNGYGASSLTILNSINEGAALLFLTPHKVLAGPYHTNVSGNLDAQRFFATRDPEEAKAIAKRRHADLIVFCVQGEETASQPKPSFLQQLIAHDIPPWLVEAPRVGNFLLFEVRQEPA